MTLRERWLVPASCVLLLALPTVLYWHFTRYNVALQAVQKYVQLEDQSTGQDSAAKEARLTRAEARSSLASGDFEAAFLRMTKGATIPQTAATPTPAAPSLTPDELWPPKSAKRAEAHRVLSMLVQRQRAGDHVAAAQGALQEVAQQARARNKAAALVAFDRVKTLLDDMPRQAARRESSPARAPNRLGLMEGTFSGQAFMRPGGSPPGNGPLPPAAIPPEFRPGMNQRGRPGRPDMMQAPPGAMRPGPSGRPAPATSGPRQPGGPPDVQTILDSVRSMPEPLYQKHRAELAVALTRAIGAGGTAGNGPGGAGAGGNNPTAKPTNGAPGAAPPSPGPLPTVRPTASPKPSSTEVPTVPQRVPATPKPDAGTTPRPTPSATPSAGLSPTGRGADIAAGARLNFGPSGKIRNLSVFGQDLSSGLNAGGLSLLLPDQDPSPLRGSMTASDHGLTGRLGIQQVFAVQYREERQGITIEAIPQGTRLSPGTALTITIPIDVRGGAWDANGTSQLIVGWGSYSIRATKTGVPLRLRTVKFSLSLDTPAGSTITYTARSGALQIHIPLSSDSRSYAVRVSAQKLSTQK